VIGLMNYSPPKGEAEEGILKAHFAQEGVI
jgi:hypothetical protein